MTLPVAQDVVERGLSRLLWQWRESPVLKGLVESYLTVGQEIDATFFQLLSERGVNEAVGEQLNVLGDIVGEDRLGRDDGKYRAAILSRGLINNSNGTPEELLEILAAATGATAPALWEHFSGTTMLYVEKGATPFVAHAMQSASPAGTYTALMFDIEQDSFIGSEVAFSDNILEVVNVATEKDMEVLDSEASNFDLAISDGVGSPIPRAFLAEINERVGGSQSILNPTLALDTDWVKGTGWVIASGATKTAGVLSSLEQPVSFVELTTYVVAYTVASMTAGTLTAKLIGGTGVSGVAITANGSYEELILAKAGNVDFHLEADTLFDGVVTNVSIFELNTTPVNPLCDVFDSTSAILDILSLVTDTGDNIVDNLDNQIIGI